MTEARSYTCRVNLDLIYHCKNESFLCRSSRGVKLISFDYTIKIAGKVRLEAWGKRCELIFVNEVISSGR